MTDKKIKTTPFFLWGVKFDKHGAEVKKLAVHLANWLTVHSYITPLQPTRESILVLRQLMYLEYMRAGGVRPFILERLHGKYDRLRYQVERQEMKAVTP